MGNKKSTFSSMSDEQRIAEAEKIFIKYPRFQEILNKAEDIIDLAPIMDEPPCLMLTGPSGAGKTTISRFLREAHPRTTTKEGAVVPVLTSTIPCPASVKSLAGNLLASLGDPIPDKGSTVNMTYRLCILMRACKVQLVLLDEFQHFIDWEKLKVLSNVADWLKNLINETHKPVVLMGMPGADRILDANDQLERRFSSRITLEPFGWGEKKSEDDFRKFLKVLDEKLPFDERSQLASWEMALRIHYATGGVVGKVMALIRAATVKAVKDGQDRITMVHLFRAYEEKCGIAERMRRGDNYLNPFGAAKDKVVEKLAKEPAGMDQSIVSQLSTDRAGLKKWMRGLFGLANTKIGKFPNAA